MYAFDEVRRVCQTCTMAGLKAITEAKTRKPFRFVYMSGDAANEEEVKNPRFMPEYVKLRVSSLSQQNDGSQASRHKLRSRSA
jgi:hypothetical protein